MGRTQSAAFVLAALLVAPQLPAQSPGDPIAGRKVAARLCAGCHDIGGPGPSPVPAAPPFSRLHKTLPAEDLFNVFEGDRLARHADVEMPLFSFTPEEIDDLLAYVRSLPP